MKRSLFILWVTVCACVMQAVDYQYLVFVNTSGTTTALSVSDMTLTVSGGNLVVANTDGTETFMLTDLAAMQFSKDGTFTALDNVINGDEPVDVYTIVGTTIGHFDNLLQATKQLQVGAYVIKQGNNTQKIVVK